MAWLWKGFGAQSFGFGFRVCRRYGLHLVLRLQLLPVPKGSSRGLNLAGKGKLEFRALICYVEWSWVKLTEIRLSQVQGSAVRTAVTKRLVAISAHRSPLDFKPQDPTPQTLNPNY